LNKKFVIIKLPVEKYSSEYFSPEIADFYFAETQQKPVKIIKILEKLLKRNCFYNNTEAKSSSEMKKCKITFCRF